MTAYYQDSSNFYVHIVESLAPQNYYNGLTTGRALCSFLDVSGISYLYFPSYTRYLFELSLSAMTGGGIAQGISLYKKIPIIHIAAHGFDDYSGIHLTDNSHMTWAELALSLQCTRQQLIATLNSDFLLGIVMSSCYGASANFMAYAMRDNPCFEWLIGSEEEITFCDAALSFAIFYRMLQKQITVGESCDIASKVHPLKCFHGKDIQILKNKSSILIEEIFSKYNP